MWPGAQAAGRGLQLMDSMETETSVLWLQGTELQIQWREPRILSAASQWLDFNLWDLGKKPVMLCPDSCPSETVS